MDYMNWNFLATLVTHWLGTSASLTYVLPQSSTENPATVDSQESFQSMIDEVNRLPDGERQLSLVIREPLTMSEITRIREEIARQEAEMLELQTTGDPQIQHRQARLDDLRDLLSALLGALRRHDQMAEDTKIRDRELAKRRATDVEEIIGANARARDADAGAAEAWRAEARAVEARAVEARLAEASAQAARAAESRAAEAMAEARAAEDREAEAREAEARAAEARVADARVAAEARTAEARVPAEARAAQARAAGATASEARAAEARAVEARAVEARVLAEARAAGATASEARAAEARAVEARVLAEARAAEATASEARAAEAMATEARAADARAAAEARAAEARVAAEARAAQARVEARAAKAREVEALVREARAAEDKATEARAEARVAQARLAEATDAVGRAVEARAVAAIAADTMGQAARALARSRTIASQHEALALNTILRGEQATSQAEPARAGPPSTLQTAESAVQTTTPVSSQLAVTTRDQEDQVRRPDEGLEAEQRLAATRERTMLESAAMPPAGSGGGGGRPTGHADDPAAGQASDQAADQAADQESGQATDQDAEEKEERGVDEDEGEDESGGGGEDEGEDEAANPIAVELIAGGDRLGNDGRRNHQRDGRYYCPICGKSIQHLGDVGFDPCPLPPSTSTAAGQFIKYPDTMAPTSISGAKMSGYLISWSAATYHSELTDSKFRLGLEAILKNAT
ncbi:hypothetical protein HOY80DRAFT_619710 [Tuber brumale]|nr:hypothetical protein HOY80DRAFT_619710 [Tuber brumale]